MTQSMNALLVVGRGDHVWPPPIWLMRQAGRYLPEYRKLREKAGSFWTLCTTPELATEASLQPLKRFALDAVIVFSDILLVPYALGQSVIFEEGVGPRLGPLESVKTLQHDQEQWRKKLSPAYETLHLLRRQLPADIALIGFTGGPWTLITYMLGMVKNAQGASKKLTPELSHGLLDLVTRIVSYHLVEQLNAGADIVQIFDSHAGLLSEDDIACYLVEPTRQVVEGVRALRSDAPIIGFPRGATSKSYERYARETGVDVVSLDTAVDAHWAVSTLGDRVALQGNLDPRVLLNGGSTLDDAVDRILEAARGARFIFNLGHGVLPDTPVAHVERMIARVRGAK